MAALKIALRCTVQILHATEPVDNLLMIGLVRDIPWRTAGRVADVNSAQTVEVLGKMPVIQSTGLVKTRILVAYHDNYSCVALEMKWIEYTLLYGDHGVAKQKLKVRDGGPLA